MEITSTPKSVLSWTIILFVVFLTIGTGLSLQKLLWTDELFTQTHTIDPIGYQEILTGQFSEGNLCPLYYLIQKSVCIAFHYKLPFHWIGENSVYEPSSQWILRIPANIFMSLALALIFWFFARYYSLGAGWFALGVTLSSPIVWLYWVEARPYGLWFLLTMIQLLFLLYSLRQPQSNRWILLGSVHILLSLCIVLSAPQILFVSLIFYLYKDRNPIKYLWITALPLTVCYLYHLLSKQIYAWLPSTGIHNTPAFFSIPDLIHYASKHWNLFIAPNMPSLWLLFFGVGIMVTASSNKKTLDKKEALVFLVLLCSLFATAILILNFFRNFSSIPANNFSISERYFIFLAPSGIITFVLLSLDLWNAFRDDRWLRLSIGAGIGGILLVSFIQTFFYIFSLGLYQ